MANVTKTSKVAKGERIVEDDVRLWHEQPWDTEKSFTAFQMCYLSQDRPRAVAEAYRQWCKMTNRKPKLYKGKQLIVPYFFWYWANGLDSRGNRQPGTEFENAVSWQERAHARDDEEQHREDGRWFRRQAEIRKTEWDKADELLKRADDLLAAKAAADADYREMDIANMFDLALRMKRRAANMPEKVTAIDWRKEVARMGLNPDETLESLIQQLVATSDPEY